MEGAEACQGELAIEDGSVSNGIIDAGGAQARGAERVSDAQGIQVVGGNGSMVSGGIVGAEAQLGAADSGGIAGAEAQLSAAENVGTKAVGGVSGSKKTRRGKRGGKKVLVRGTFTTTMADDRANL